MAEIIANWIAGVGVLFTAVFSYLVYRVTDNSTKIAEEALNLNRRLIQEEARREFQQRKIIRMQIVPGIIDKSNVVYDALTEEDVSRMFKKIRDAPTELEVDVKDFAEYFSEDEVLTVTKAWSMYTDYRKSFYKPRYGGNEIEILKEKAPPVIEAFADIFKKIERK